MKTSKIITWLRDKLPYAPDHAWKNKMQETATMLARLESNLKTAAAQRNEYQEKYLAQRERNTQLEGELKAEMYRHDRYRDYTLGLEQKIEQPKDRHRWIPVTERLPQEDLPVGAVCDTVQVLLQSGAVTVGWCNRDLKCWYYLPVDETKFVGHGYDPTPVVAWKPLSEPPKEV